MAQKLMSKVVTVTLNPAFDTTLTLDGIYTDKINRPVAETRISAGKGINISESLSALGMETVAAALVGRDSLESFRRPLDEKGLHCRFVITDGAVRENLTLLAGGSTVKINRVGSPVDEESLSKLKELIRDIWEDGDIIVFSGSIPDGISEDKADSLISYASECGYLVAVDSERISAERLMKLKPWLIKPNEHELGLMVGQPLSDIDEMLSQCDKMIKGGVNQILLTLGEKGLYLITGDKKLHAIPPETTEVNTVGAGDCALAGYIYAYITGMTARDSAAFSAACGCAVVASQLPYLTDTREVTALAEQTTVI